MDIKQLLTMITLSQTLNYQKAAEQLQYAPSTLFKHIQMLEQEVGAPLFCKTGRQLALTPAGRGVLWCTPTAWWSTIIWRWTASARRRSWRARSRVGGCEINIGNSLLTLFEQFHTAHAETRLNMMMTHNAGVPALIRSDMLDIGFFYTTRPGAVSGLRAVPLYREPVYIMVSWDHPLAQKKGLKYEALEGMQFMYPHDTCCFVGEFLPMLEKMGIHLEQDDVFGRRSARGGAGAQGGRDDACAALRRAALPRRLRAGQAGHGRRPDLGVGKHRLQKLRNAQARRPRAGAVAARSMPTDLSKKDTSGWIARPNGTA